MRLLTLTVIVFFFLKIAWIQCVYVCMYVRVKERKVRPSEVKMA